MNHPSPVVLFSRDNSDTLWDNNQLTFLGQKKQLKNDILFENPSQPFLIFKKYPRHGWIFFGEGYVVSQNRKRVMDMLNLQQPTVPEWNLEFFVPTDFECWNHELSLQKNEHNYLTKKTILEYIGKKLSMKPVSKNAHQHGIVSLVHNLE